MAAQHPRAMAAAAVVLVAVTGCGRGDPESPPGSSPSPPPVASTPAVDQVGIPTAEFPLELQEYAEAAVAAWAAPDLIRLAELATSNVLDYIVELPGPPDLSWSFIDCDADESSACSFYNTDGDQLVVTVDQDLLGKSEAVVEAEFDAIGYPDDAEEYVVAFVTAWQDGNLARMEGLAVPDAAAVFHQLAPEPEVSYRVGQPDDGRVVVVVDLAEVEVRVEVNGGLYGESHAIRTAVVAEP